VYHLLVIATGTAMVDTPRLKELRERAVLTQAELAQLSGVSRVTIARAEVGLVSPHPSTVRKLAKVLGVRAQDLLRPPAAGG
jgi:DNA-binding XRE family transcriptional regulator